MSEAINRNWEWMFVPIPEEELTEAEKASSTHLKSITRVELYNRVFAELQEMQEQIMHLRTRGGCQFVSDALKTALTSVQAAINEAVLIATAEKEVQQ